MKFSIIAQTSQPWKFVYSRFVSADHSHSSVADPTFCRKGKESQDFRSKLVKILRYNSWDWVAICEVLGVRMTKGFHVAFGPRRHIAILVDFWLARRACVTHEIISLSPNRCTSYLPQLHPAAPYPFAFLGAPCPTNKMINNHFRCFLFHFTFTSHPITKNKITKEEAYMVGQSVNF